MADERSPESPERPASPRRQVDAPETRAAARARLRGAAGAIGPDLSSAAARAVAELRISFAQRSAQFGFLDDVVDFTHDVVDVTEEFVNHLAANTEEITHQLEEITPEITPVTAVIVGAGAAGFHAVHGEGGPTQPPLEGSGGITDESRGASARELLRARQAIIDEAVAIHSNALKAFAQSLRAQIAAIRRPKP